MTTCVFCHDNLDDHHGNLQYPGGSRWLCGTCVTWAVTTRYLQDREAASQAARAEAAEVERKAAELATGVDDPRFLGYDSAVPEQQVIWTGDTIPQSADGLTAIPAGVVEIEDTQG